MNIETRNEKLIRNNCVFLRTPDFNNGRAVRPLPFYGIHSWAVKPEDKEEFLDIYYDVRWEEAEVPEGYKVYAMNYHEEADPFVLGKRKELPELLEFDEDKHSVQLVQEAQYCWCGCGKFEGSYTKVENPYQILIAREEELVASLSGLYIEGLNYNEWLNTFGKEIIQQQGNAITLEEAVDWYNKNNI